MKKSNIFFYAILAVMIASLIGVMITGNLLVVRVWLISLGMLFIIGFLKLSEKEHKDWSAGSFDLFSVIIGTIMDFLPLWIVKIGGVLLGSIIIFVGLFLI